MKFTNYLSKFLKMWHQNLTKTITSSNQCCAGLGSIDRYSASSALFHTCSIQASSFFMGIVLLFMHPTQACT
jgi:hypothetical protein